METAPPSRLTSLDAYRGFVMFMLAANAFGLAKLAQATESSVLDWLGFQASHPAWLSQFHLVGFSLWDMIQPAFMFIVGVAVPFSYAKRQSLGQSDGQIFRHALVRALILVLLGVFLQSQRAPQTNWLFTNVLSQIGLGYAFLYFVVGRPFRIQLLVGIGVLALTWLIYVLYPIAEGNAAAAAAGETGMLPGFYGHWSFNANAGAAFDQWFLNLFPRAKPWDGHPGGYSTLNFIPSFVTMLMGLMCGQTLQKPRLSAVFKLRRLLIGGALCLIVALILSQTICPVVKRIWTPSWTLFSGAYVIWLLALFYWIIDLKGWAHWSFPFVVVGLNPIAMYFMDMTMKGWVTKQLDIHFGIGRVPEPYSYVVTAALVVLVFWLICYWMFRNRIFIRI